MTTDYENSNGSKNGSNGNASGNGAENGKPASGTIFDHAAPEGAAK